MTDVEQFQTDLEALGFRLIQERGSTAQFSLSVSPYLTFWVHWEVPADRILFTWEHAIGEYFNAAGMQIGSNDEMNGYLFPKYDAKGPVDITFVVDEMDRVEQILRQVNLLEGAP